MYLPSMASIAQNSGQQFYQSPFLLTTLIIIYMNTSQKAYSKLKWTSEEEQLLRSLKEQKHIDSWKIIANEMNQIFHEKNRSGKQCRQRYMNYVRFGNGIPKISGWTPEEDQLLFFKFMAHGAKWVQIGREMEGRSQNCLKNRFYGALRKIIRKINRAAKEKKLRQKKPIKTDLLIRILESPSSLIKGGEKQPVQSLEFLQQLKKEMIKIAINPEQNSSSDQIQCLINGITKFCSVTKSLNQRKNIIKQKEEEEGNSEDAGAIEEQDVESVEIGNSQSKKDDEDKTLTDKNPCQTKHKIVKNFILFSSQENYDYSQKGIFSSLGLFKNRPPQISTLPQQQSDPSV